MFDLRIQIVRLRSKLEPPRRIEQLWIVEFDGAPIRPERRLEIQDRVLEAVDSTARPSLRLSAAIRPGDERPGPLERARWAQSSVLAGRRAPRASIW